MCQAGYDKRARQTLMSLGKQLESMASELGSDLHHSRHMKASTDSLRLRLRLRLHSLRLRLHLRLHSLRLHSLRLHSLRQSLWPKPQSQTKPKRIPTTVSPAPNYRDSIDSLLLQLPRMSRSMRFSILAIFPTSTLAVSLNVVPKCISYA